MEKIIFIQRSFSPYLQRLFNKLNTSYNRHIEVVYLRIDLNRFWNDEINNSEYKYINLYNYNFFKKIKYLTSLRNNNYKIILTTDFSTYLYNFIISLFVKKYKIWITIYDEYNLTKSKIVNKISIYLMKYLIKFSSDTTLSYSSKVIKLCGKKKNIIGSQYYGLEEVYGQINSDDLKQNNKFLLISYLNERKNVDSLISIFNKFNSLELIILGNGETKYVNKLKSLAGDNIKFYGYADAKLKKKFFGECNYLIFHSTKDSWGYTVAEAQYFGLEVIGNINSMAVLDLVKPNINGYHYKNITELDQILNNINNRKIIPTNDASNLKKNILKKNNDDIYLKNIITFLE